MSAHEAARGQRADARPDSLSIEEFALELRYGIRPDAVATVENPLDAALVLIEKHPQHLQSVLLARILSALTFGGGQFRKSEVFGLDRPSRLIAVALGDVRLAGTVPIDAWQHAVEAIGMAQARPA